SRESARSGDENRAEGRRGPRARQRNWPPFRARRRRSSGDRRRAKATGGERWLGRRGDWRSLLKSDFIFDENPVHERHAAFVGPALAARARAIRGGEPRG